MFDDWKNKFDQSLKDKNQPKIYSIFSPDSEKCKYMRTLKNALTFFQKNQDS